MKIFSRDFSQRTQRKIKEEIHHGGHGVTRRGKRGWLRRDLKYLFCHNSDKKTVPEDHAKFYNIVAAFTLERILKHTEDLNTTR